MLHMKFCNCRRSLQNAAKASITRRSTIGFHIYSTGRRNSSITPIFYSTIMSFHQIRSRERAKFKTVIHCSVLVWPVYNRANTDKDISLAFCVFYVIRTRRNWWTDTKCRVYFNTFLKRKAKIIKSFCSGIINLVLDGFTYNIREHFAHCYATSKIAARIICKTIEWDKCIIRVNPPYCAQLTRNLRWPNTVFQYTDVSKHYLKTTYFWVPEIGMVQD